MKIEEFIENCNKSPLFKRNNILVTKKTLEDFDFIKNEYEVPQPDLLELSRRISRNIFEVILPIEPKELNEIYQGKKWNKKLLHKDLMKRIYNQNLIMRCRKNLNMPFCNRGFNLANTATTKKFPAIERHFTNVNFEFIEPAYMEWFFSFAEGMDYNDEYEKWEKTTRIVFKKIDEIANKVLQYWKLNKYYKDAIIELIVFNRIIPSDSGISEMPITEKDGSKRDAIIPGEGVSQQELIEYIKNYYRKKKFKRESRSPRKLKETEKIVALYNLLESTMTDKAAFEEIHRRYPKISVRAIQKRIKGY